MHKDFTQNGEKDEKHPDALLRREVGGEDWPGWSDKRKSNKHSLQ